MCNFLHPGWLDPLYKPHFICFSCRKGFKVRDAAVERYWALFHADAESMPAPELLPRSVVGARCPECANLMQPVCACVEVPRRTQHGRWKALRERFAVASVAGRARPAKRQSANRRALVAPAGAFTVRHAVAARESFGPYRYDILLDSEVIALYWHDYRGDAHGIRFEDGTTVDEPVGRMTDFLQGGGAEPLTLSPSAIAWLESRPLGGRARKRVRRPGERSAR